MLRLNIITLILKLFEDATNVVVVPFVHGQAKNGISNIICDFWVLFFSIQKR
jgi:hypothetical protein